MGVCIRVTPEEPAFADEGVRVPYDVLILDLDGSLHKSHAGGTGVCGRGRPRSV
ncbi:MAG: hypothetical protein AB7J13_13865 [Pyrinomonadaceae bacterium]